MVSYFLLIITGVATISPARKACPLFLNLKCNLVSSVIYLVKRKITTGPAAAFFHSSYMHSEFTQSENLLTYIADNKIYNHGGAQFILLIKDTCV